MLKGMRTAIKYFTIGFLAGLLLAPRKGDETRKLLVERGKEYVQEMLGATEQATEQARQQVREAQQHISQA
jgi:gas vesicle protein